MKKVGLALGGGGARGFAHIGVLRILEREKIPIQCIAGTSMGAIIGACYAVEPDIEAILHRINKILITDLFSGMKIKVFKQDDSFLRKSFFSRAQSIIRTGYLYIVGETHHSLVGLDKLEDPINKLLPDIDISQTRIPYACVATDLTHGRMKIFTRGSLRRCVLASASIPGIFPPVEIDGIHYTDGGAVSVTPVHAAKKLGAEFIVASDVKSKIVRWEKPEKASEIMSRSNYITGVMLNELHLKDADVVITPAVKHLHWADFDKLDFIISRGEKAAEFKMLELKMKTSYNGVVSKVFDFFGLGKKSNPFEDTPTFP
jgi:NTE family protein